MRLATIRRHGAVRPALEIPGEGFAVSGRLEGDLGVWLAQGPEALRGLGAALAAAPRFEAAELEFLPPVPAPSKIICVGMNYAGHIAEVGAPTPQVPPYFTRFASSLVGHEGALIRPAQSDQFDFEGELAVVIGARCRDVSAEAALGFVAGYAVFNDASVRDYQLRTPQWFMGKNFDGTGGFGPLLVTADELPPGASGLKLETRLNGAVVQSGRTDDLVFDVAALIADLAQAITLEPGDVIVTGTPSGVGFSRKPQLWMKPGDLCEVEIEGLGLLRNSIRDHAAAGS